LLQKEAAYEGLHGFLKGLSGYAIDLVSLTFLLIFVPRTYPVQRDFCCVYDHLVCKICAPDWRARAPACGFLGGRLHQNGD